MINLTEMFSTTTQTITANDTVAYTNISLDLGNSITPAITGTNTITSAGVYELIAEIVTENSTASAVDSEFVFANNGSALVDTEASTTTPANGNSTITMIDIIRVKNTNTGNNVVISVVSPTGATLAFSKLIVKKIA